MSEDISLHKARGLSAHPPISRLLNSQDALVSYQHMLYNMRE